MPLVTTDGPSSQQGDENVAQRLYLASRHHARTAQRLLGAESHWERMDAAYHAGAAVELIAKSALATLDKRLLLTGPVLHDVILDALAVQYERPDVVVRERSLRGKTIEAGRAIQLTHRLLPEVRDHRGAADAALAARNDAAHMAVLDDARLDDVVAGMLSYVNAAATASEQGTADLWGGGLQAEVDRVTRARLDRIERGAQVKVVVARENYGGLAGALSQETREKWIAELADRPVPSSDVESRVDCPACELPYARVQWNADYEAVRDGDGWSYEGGLALVGLLCPICNLSLDAAEVGALGVDTSMWIDEEDILSDQGFRDDAPE